MRIPHTVRDRFQLLDRAHFEKIKDSEFRPSYELSGLKYLREKAGNERNLRELYRNRAPYELLQNADDAGAKKVAFILSRDGLVFAHDGHWFTVDNFRSLADGWSDKDPNECIGHKGLGFRSVLDITPAPCLVKIDATEFFAVKFTWALNNGHIQEAFRRDGSLRSYYESWTKYGQLACPVMAIPGLAKRQNLGTGSTVFDVLVRGKYGVQFTTMFWFPAIDPDIDRKVLQELSPTPIIADQHGRQALLEFMKDEVSTLVPFLRSLKEVRVYENDQCIGLVRMSGGVTEQKDGEISILTRINRQSHSQSFFRRRFMFPIPPKILNQPDTPKAVRAMKEVEVVLSCRLEDGQPVYDDESRFHVYFPTAESTGVGFVVHGDFYVKPDRTRLMDGHYNKWLLARAAKAAANTFLTQLLERYHARAVFAALSPTHSAPTDGAHAFTSMFSTELQERTAPFIPTNAGLMKREEVILPPRIDESGFWEIHFSDAVTHVVAGKRAFLSHEEDGQRTRTFLHLAQVQGLESEALLAFIEASGQETKSAGWWYECYCYMANDRELFGCEYPFFAGRRLIPTTDSSVIAVPDDSSIVVCLPPTGDTSALQVPECFSSVFVFLDSEVAMLLERGKDTVRSWVLDRLRISRFEATDLLPRALRRVVTALFSGELGISSAELTQAWTFIKKIIEISPRTILSAKFWQEVGRFPLPLQSAALGRNLKPESLAPAFLTYWPDSFVEGEHCLGSIEGLRRISEKFLNELVVQSGMSRTRWIEFFERAGVSAAPKLLKYSRMVTAEEALPFTPGAPTQFQTEGFCGERQSDENRAVIETLRTENLWDATVKSVAPCSHGLPTLLQSLTLLEGLHHCTQMAEREYQNENDKWCGRLWSLIRGLLVSSVAELDDDKVFCRGGGPGGHSISAGSYLRRQLDHYGWLPSSQGPTNGSTCFLRLSSRRLISSGRTGEELGDKLLPYVTVDSIDDLAKLQRLEVEVLDDAASASPSTLVHALALLGERLSAEWGRKEIIEARSRWRLVRGAIQEIYRCLNHSQTRVDRPPGIKFATRSIGTVEFRPCPLYYAEPGSAIERAFLGTLPLFDADRPYPTLFKQIGVIHLIPGQTVTETFLAEDTSVPAPHLRDEIANGLAPFLLAPIIARSEKTKQSELILRRLKDRFEVKTANSLRVSFSLVGGLSVAREIDFPKFYLRRRLISGPGVVQETHYTLYVAASDSVSLSVLDADILGETLAPIFLDGISDELAGLFPRIASRYQQLQGERAAMEEYMHYQLGISREAQDMASTMIFPQILEAPPMTVPSPPPARVVSSGTIDAGKRPDHKQTIEKKMRTYQEKLAQKTNNLVQMLAGTSKKKETQETTSEPATISSAEKFDEITPDQRDRGKRGEEELKRRLERPGGWEGFILLADKRDQHCGYDFLCAMGESKAKLEIKTSARDGRLIVTSLELQEAAASQDDYHLIGVLDDGKPEYEWSTFLIRNPLDILMTKGEFDIQARLQASAIHVFGLEKNHQA